MPKPDSVNLILTFCEPDSDNEINIRNLRTLMIEFSDSVVAKSKTACVLPPCAIGKTFNIITNWLII